MGLFSRFENKAEDIIEGSGGGRRGGIEPVKLAKRASKEMEREKMVGVGHEYAPVLYTILVSPSDDAAMNGYYPSLAGEIETYLTSKAAQSGLVFDCPPLVRFMVNESLKRGHFNVFAESVSPSILAELRHEEMVHYGIEAPDSFQDEPPFDAAPVQQGDFEPETYIDASQDAYPAEQGAYDDESASYLDEPQSADRLYPPVESPENTPSDIYNADDAAQTALLDQPLIEQEPQAELLDHNQARRYSIKGARIVIGREKSCDVVLSDPSVSRRHAEILHSDAGWLIRDTGSTNGTSINGTVETQSRLYSGDIIELGHIQLEFQEA